MTFRGIGLNLFTRGVLLFATMLGSVIVLTQEWYITFIVLLALLVLQCLGYYRLHRRIQREIDEFSESIYYRDFTKRYGTRHRNGEMNVLYQSFNRINETLRQISLEKETQYLHLKTILEIVDTGILSFDTESGEIIWMNESLRDLLQIPYLRYMEALHKRDPEFYNELMQLQPGGSHVSVMQSENGPFKVLLSVMLFESEQRQYKLIVFQNISEALDVSEAQAWQKLLSVLTHEIMNSVAPIASLAETLRSRIPDAETNKDSSGDLETGINTIQTRSEGLLKFTESYRNLSRIRKAASTKILLIELFEHIQHLMQPSLDKHQIELDLVLREPLLSLEADAALIEQCLINLLLNAIAALKDRPEPRITLSAEASISGHVTIRMQDNGCGIKPELLDKIFIPFFSTRENGSGSGIGLSLCKQVMHLHKGSIQVESAEGEGTTFSLIF